MKRRDFVKSIATLGSSAYMIPKYAVGSELISSINDRKTQKKLSLADKSLADYRRFYEFIGLSSYDGKDTITVDYDLPCTTPHMDDYIKMPTYRICSSINTKDLNTKHDIKMNLLEMHNRKVITDIESNLAATLADIGKRDIDNPIWKQTNELMRLHYVDLRTFDGFNHIDLNIEPLWQILIPRGVKIGKVFRIGFKMEKHPDSDNDYFSTERIGIIGFNTHIFARPFKEEV